MEARPAQPGDWTRIKELYVAGGYKFDLPTEDEIRGAHVVVEDGKIIGWAAGQPQWEIFAVVDMALSPHRRMDAFLHLHVPRAKAARRVGVVKVSANIDETYPALAKRLMKFGWVKPLWTQMSLRIDAVLGKENVTCA